MGTLIGIVFVLVIAGFVWWAISTKLWPLISPFIAEPFRTIAYIIVIFILLCIVLWVIAALLAMVGIHVTVPGLGRF